MHIDRNEERILIKISDENFNIYKCIITDDDLFVVNFCKRNLEKMEKILKNGSIVNIDNHYILKVEDPIFLEYVLHKEMECNLENFDVLMERFRKFQEDNNYFRRKIYELEKKNENIYNILKGLQEQIDGIKIYNSKISEKILYNFENIY